MTAQQITLFQCDVDPDLVVGDAVGFEAAWCLAQVQEHQREYDEQRRAEDMAERLAGPCERCQEPQDDVLTVVGGEAMCDRCVESEVSP